MEIRPEIQKFAKYMESIMREHDKIKGDSWKKMHREDLKELFKKEVNEALESNTDSEFIDVANFCMMIVNTPIKLKNLSASHNNDFIQDCLKNLSEFWMDAEGNLNYRQKCLGKIKQS